jgi:signal transduction histidine kinase
MKTIKRKILTPMILLIVLVPMATLLFFNIAVQVYVQKTDRGDLKETISLVETLSKQELGGSRAITEARLEGLTIKIVDALEASRLTGARLLIFNNKTELIYPKALPDGAISSNLVKQVAARVKTTDFTDRIEQIKQGKTTYLMAGYIYTSSNGGRISITILSQQGVTSALISIINLILFLIMLIGIGLGAFIASRITGRMSRNVEEITNATEKIGSGDFAQPKWEKTDIEEFGRLSQSITRMSKRLEASERSQRDFLQSASHELRTPLMSIQGYAEGISRDIVPNVKEACEIINSESRRLNSLVGELLTLSRIESRNLERSLTSLNLNQLLPEYVQRLGGIAVKNKKKIELLLPLEKKTINGDEELLGQAMCNIISNCLRYASEKVYVQLLGSDNEVIIQISDDGPGILETELPHIFERFYKGKGGNFGLGLAIAKSAIEYIGGDIKAYNGEKGAVFEIILKMISA